MEKLQINQAVLRPAAFDSRKDHLFILFLICLLMGVSLAVSLALLGGSLGRFSQADTNVILLIPTENNRMEAAREPAPGENGFTPTEKAQPEAALEKNDASGSTSLTQTTGGTRATGGTQTPGGARSAGRTGTSGYTNARAKGSMQVYDSKKVWKSVTQVDLFQSSYDGTVISEDGEKVIAPGTANSYWFTVKNNGNMPLDYTISLGVDTFLGEDETDSAIPLQWRLLSDDGKVVTDWKGYNERTEILKRDSLKARNQDKYTIEWKWPFEREGMDGADTEMGNTAVIRPLGAKATITVYAEQSAGWKSPSGPWWLPKTGDDFPLYTYLTAAAVSGCGLWILFVTVRRKKDEEEKHVGKKA